MDMVQATGVGGVPANAGAMSGVTLVGGPISDGDKSSIIHGVLMVFSTLILYPFGVILIGAFKSVRIHAINSCFLLFLALVGLGLGIYVSTEYNRACICCH
jgi:hypothetical protein